MKNRKPAHGLILIEGGTFVMGRTEQDVLYDWDNIPEGLLYHHFIWMKQKLEILIGLNIFTG